MRHVILIAALTFCFESHASDFNIEDGDLRPLPSGAASTIQKSLASSSYGECNRFDGKPVDLSGKGKPTDWVAITAGGCA